MEHYLTTQRNRIYYYIWEMEKENLAMDDLADILHINPKTFYRILKKERIKEIKEL